MKDEYDFSDAEQGKFYRPIEELDVPVYLDPEVMSFLTKHLQQGDQTLSLSKVVNSLLKKDIEISEQLSK
ncbi:MAG: hypothetical protein ACPG4N_05920 [Gammaproteobacteria bacterium]